MRNVDLVVNCYEKTYEKVLTKEYWESLVAQNKFIFANKVVLINNVKDLNEVKRIADALVATSGIDQYYVVEEQLPKALEVTGLTLNDLGANRYFTDCAIVALTIQGSEWLVYWDADVVLKRPVDWLTPALELLEKDADIIVANPEWNVLGEAKREAESCTEDFAIGYGFSDQLFLTKREYLAQKIYRFFCIPALRYPMSHITPIFEARIDAYMRVNKKKRATYLKACYVHPTCNAGDSHLKATEDQMAVRRIFSFLLQIADRFPPNSPQYNDPCWRVSPKK